MSLNFPLGTSLNNLQLNEVCITFNLFSIIIMLLCQQAARWRMDRHGCALKYFIHRIAIVSKNHYLGVECVQFHNHKCKGSGYTTDLVFQFLEDTLSRQSSVQIKTTDDAVVPFHQTTYQPNSIQLSLLIVSVNNQ